MTNYHESQANNILVMWWLLNTKEYDVREGFYVLLMGKEIQDTNH